MAGDVQNLRPAAETFPKRVDGGDLRIAVELFPRDAKLLIKLLKFQAMLDRCKPFLIWRHIDVEVFRACKEIADAMLIFVR